MTEPGTEFGTEKGMVMIIARALYVLNISGSERREKLIEILNSLGFKPSKENADICMKRYFKPIG